MAEELKNTMPNPDDNIQLGEGAVPPSEILGGDIQTQVVYRPQHTSFAMAIAAAKADQEAMCGYPLIMTKSREVELADAEGRYNEVFVTFSPVPTVSEEQKQLDASLRAHTSENPPPVEMVPPLKDLTQP